MKIQFVEKDDYQQILHIYQPYIEKTAITFEYDVPSIEEFSKRIDDIKKDLPYLVVKDENKVLGYAYASHYRGRQAFAWDVELSIYLDENITHQGIGTQLYDELMSLLKKQGYFRAYACITYPHPMSISFHQKYGFKMIGIFHQAGYKFDQWLDVAWMEYSIQDGVPKPIKKIDEVL